MRRGRVVMYLMEGTQLWNPGRHEAARRIFGEAVASIAEAEDDRRAADDGGIDETLRDAAYAWYGRAYLHTATPDLTRPPLCITIAAQPLRAEYSFLLGEALEQSGGSAARHRAQAHEAYATAALLEPGHRGAWQGAHRTALRRDPVDPLSYQPARPAQVGCASPAARGRPPPGTSR